MFFFFIFNFCFFFVGKKKAAPPAPAPPPRGLSNGVTAVPPVPTPRKPDERSHVNVVNSHVVDDEYSDVVTERIQFNECVEDIKPKGKFYDTRL